MRLQDGLQRGDATGFSWRMVATGGTPWQGGMGFAMPDNLAIDRAGNVWMVTDRSGGSFEQLRQVPLGSSWPSPVPGRPLL